MSIWKNKEEAVLALLLAAGPVAAAADVGAMQCRFETECFEDEACADADFTMSLSAPAAVLTDMSSRSVVAETEFGDLAGFVYASEGLRTVYIFEQAPARYFLTRDGQGARLSLHLPGPEVVTYLGTCEEEN